MDTKARRCVASLGVALLVSMAAAQQPVELRFMFWGSGAEKEAVEGAIKQFNNSHPGIHVTAQHVPGDYATKVNTLIAAKQTPDVAYMPEGLALKLGEQGQLLEMSKYFKAYPALKDRLPQTYLYFAPGKTIGTYIAPEITTLYFNRTLFKAANVAFPPAEVAKAWTWDQFVKTAQQLTLDRNGKNALDPAFDTKNIKQFGVSFPTGFIGWYPLLRANGADITDPTGKKYMMNSPQAVEAFQRLQDLMWKYHVAPTPTQLQNSPSTTVQLQSRKVAMAIDGQWILLDIAQSKLNVGVGVLPKMKTSTTVFVGGASVIFASTKHPKEALELYMYYNDPTKVDLYKKGLWMPLELKLL